MAADKRWRLVAYDIREPARWRKVYKIMCGAGEWVQYSLFRCRLDNREVERLRWQLAQVIATEDSLLVVDLCPTCASNVVARNHVDGWEMQPPTFRIIVGKDADRDHERLDGVDEPELEPSKGVSGRDLPGSMKTE